MLPSEQTLPQSTQWDAPARYEAVERRLELCGTGVLQGKDIAVMAVSREETVMDEDFQKKRFVGTRIVSDSYLKNI